MEQWLQALEDYLQLLQLGAYMSIAAVVISVFNGIMIAVGLEKISRMDRNYRKAEQYEYSPYIRH